MSQALIDTEISHEEIISILKEKDKCEKIKENLKSEIEKYEIMRLSSIESKTYVKNQMKNSQKYFMSSTKFIFFPSVCTKCFKSANKNIKKRKIEIIDKERYFWVNRKDLEIESDVANWVQIFDK